MNTDNTSIQILTRSFEERKLRNPRYSLRAFSRDVGVSVSHMCCVLQGKKKLSPNHACQIAVRLQFDRDQFYELVTSAMDSEELR